MLEKNIVFMDGEFAKLKPDGIDLLSIALIKSTGEELYLEIEFYGEVGVWEKENVLSKLTEKKVSKKKAVELIRDFIGNKKPYLIAYVNQFDWIGICRLFDAKDVNSISKLPFNVIPIDLASILFAKGIEPNLSLLKIAENLSINILDIEEHNALDDARLLKKVYYKITNN